MSEKKVKVFIKPILNPKHIFSSSPIREIEGDLLIPTKTKIKNVCAVVLEKLGLKKLSNTSQAFIQLPDTRMYDCCTFPPTKMYTIQFIRDIAGDSFIIRILAYGENKDFDATTLKEPLYCNLLDLLIKNSNLINDCKENLVVKNAIISMNNSDLKSIPYETLLTFTEAMKKEIESNIQARSISNGINSLTLCQNSNNSRIQLPLPNIDENSIRSICSKSPSSEDRDVKFCKIREKHVLEHWYRKNKYPTSSEYREYVKKLNEMSKRPSNCMITKKQVKKWFHKQRSKERRRIYSLTKTIPPQP
uniref:Homeobox domain-containing protein n=1 Tax=Strongyloides venezuelensis TaxID=75913 RepID=A0A0K0FNF2_STRVS